MSNAATRKGPAERRSREWWAEAMERYEERKDECTARQFAEEEGVPFHALKYRVWKKGKEVRAKERKKEGAGTPRWENEGCESISLVPVQVVGEVVESRGPVDRDDRLEGETGGGLRVRFNEGTNVRYVAELVSQLAATGGSSC